MNNNSTIDNAYIELAKYVNATADLAESVERDIRNGNKISSDTVLALSKLIAAAKRVENIVDMFEDITLN